MKRTRIFTLVMAIFWTILGAVVLIMIPRIELNGPMRLLLTLMVFITVAGNWLRWYRSR